MPVETVSTDRIEKQIELKAPVSRVWPALADHLEFGEWFRTRVEAPFVVGQHRRETAFRGNSNGWAGQTKNLERYVFNNP